MYAQAAIKSNILLRNGAYGIVMRGVHFCTCAGASLRSRNSVPLCCIIYMTVYEMALGSVGFFAAVLSNSVIVGYLVSIGYFLFNYLGNISDTNIFCLFSMRTGDFITKVWLFGISVLWITITLIYVKKKKVC